MTQPQVPQGGRITFVGHATTLIEIGGVRLLTDPLLRDRFLFIRRQAKAPHPQTSEDIDAALISHLHADHLDYPSLRQLSEGTSLIAPHGGARTLERHGFSAVSELRPGESSAVGGVEVTATRAIHDGRRWKFGPRFESVGYLLRAPEVSVYFAGDTDLFDEMEELAGKVDVALLPIGGWGPKVGDGHLNPARAAEAAAMIKPRIVIPIHWGTFLRGDLARRAPELLHQYPKDLAAELAKRAPGVDLQVLEPGAALALG